LGKSTLGFDERPPKYVGEYYQYAQKVKLSSNDSYPFLIMLDVASKNDETYGS
jgi:hypothetical protein